MSFDPAYLQAMSRGSAELKRLLSGFGYGRADGSVTGVGLKIVSEVARRHGIRDWRDTRTPDDYVLLTTLVRQELNRRHSAPPPAASDLVGPGCPAYRQAGAPAVLKTP
jgi:hypothetical protein